MMMIVSSKWNKKAKQIIGENFIGTFQNKNPDIKLVGPNSVFLNKWNKNSGLCVSEFIGWYSSVALSIVSSPVRNEYKQKKYMLIKKHVFLF